MVWQPGVSQNPGGHRSYAPVARVVGGVKRQQSLTSLAREHTVGAIECLAEIMYDRESPPPTRVAAASALIDRGWGRAVAMTITAHTDLKTMSEAEIVALIEAKKSEPAQALVIEHNQSVEIEDAEDLV